MHRHNNWCLRRHATQPAPGKCITKTNVFHCNSDVYFNGNRKKTIPENYSGTKVTLYESPRYPLNMNETGTMQIFPPIWKYVSKIGKFEHVGHLFTFGLYIKPFKKKKRHTRPKRVSTFSRFNCLKCKKSKCIRTQNEFIWTLKDKANLYHLSAVNRCWQHFTILSAHNVRNV